MPDTTELPEWAVKEAKAIVGVWGYEESYWWKPIAQALVKARTEGEEEGIISSRQLISDVLNSFTDADAMKWVNTIRREGLKKD